jgi:ABC-type Fe3+-hydroxamate transport system substrate-binding protein
VNLNEIFDTKREVHWTHSDQGWTGSFTFDDKKFEILLDEYDALDKYSLIDFGFTVDGSWKVTGDQKSSGKILGVILNAFIEKIKELKPDCILFGVNYKNGSIENRKSLYDKISRVYARGTSYHLEVDWIKTKNGEYRILSKVNFSKEQLNKIDELADSIESKS